jgi:hypothetical protein
MSAGLLQFSPMHIHPRAERRLLALILALFVLLGFSYALITPAFEASDELWHYPMVRHLADGNPLPVQVFDPAWPGRGTRKPASRRSTTTWPRR